MLIYCIGDMISAKKFEFHFFWFTTAFLVGIVYVIVDSPKKKAVIKYPTPYNVDKTTYRGISGECYKVNVKEVKCSENAKHQTII